MIIIDKWPGLVTNASPYAIPPGAAVTQVNLQVIRPGELNVRGGMSNVSWTTHSGTTVPIISIHRVQAGTTETVMYQNASGQLYFAKGPA